MKQLEEILDAKHVKNQFDSWDLTINGIAIDSRQVKKDFKFVAYKGTTLDGHQYMLKAIEQGAKVIVLENQDYISDNAYYILVDDARNLASEIACNYYDNASEELNVIGITGTNGKTTTASLLYKLFSKLGFKCGLLSTIENRIGDRVIPAELTTPDALSLQRMFREMVSENVTHVFMEVSSHALHQGRVKHIDFDVAVFTNITRDHLDYHNTFLEYINAKRILFNELKKSAHALVNIDDINGKVMVQNSKANVVTYALRKPADFKSKVIANDIKGLHLMIQDHEVFLKLVGHFNAYNALAVYGVASILGIESLETLTALSALVAIEGRMDIVLSQKKNITGIIDYSHTPDALEKALTTIKELNTQKGRIITVVGCGGDRDKGKRPLMAKVACKWSDVIVLTSDNPRNEIPSDIIDDMMEGVSEEKENNVLRIEERKEGIKMAVFMSRPGDIILIAGKGHEKYQEVGGQKFPFNDKEIFSALIMH